MPLDVGGWQLVAALVIVMIGGLIQGVIGYGMNLVVVPLVAVLIPGSVPGSMVLLSMPMTLTMLLREHHAIDWLGVRWITTGRLPGTVIGLLVLAALPEEQLAFAIGLLIILGVVLSVIHPGIKVGRATAFGAGMVAGVSDTAASVGGPPLALLYQRAQPHTFRATLATSFLIAASVSGIALAARGRLSGEQLLLTAMFLPAMLTGLALSGPLAR
ncbi:MAG: sulfite exporter TauE/SafE family protein, partial [Acidimicrobiia bacterium]|nr:sulfite exporter TauE/SafE family protein [Acidimicrobiia bacterium]